MPNDTIVQYILSVDTGKAEKGLKETSQASKQTGKAFDQVGNSSKKMNQKLKQTEQQAKQTQRGFRNLRRAGRDLDGAFSDLGQGIGLVSPAAGNLFMTLSNGASIAEGFGRVMVGFLNPAMLAVGAITVTAGLAFSKFQAEQKETEERAKELEEATKELNKTFESQQKILQAVEKDMGSYISTINEAEADLAVLKGAIDEVSLAQMKSEKAAIEEGETAVAAQQRKIKASEAMIVALEKQIKKIGDTNKITNIGEREKALATKDRQRARIKGEKDEIRAAQAEIKNIRASAKELGRKRAETIELKQAEQDQRKANAEAARERKKQLSDERKAMAQRAKAAESLNKIIIKLTVGELSGRAKILAQQDQELAKIKNLTELSGEIEKGIEAENALRIRTNRLLDEQIKKEQAILDQQKKERQDQIAGAIQGIAGQVSAPSLGGALKVGGEVGALVSSSLGPAIGAIASTLGSTIATIGAEIMLAIEGLVASVAFLPLAIIAAGGLLVKAVLGQLVKLGEKTPDERRKDNRDRAESLKSGLEFLPEILLQVIPEFAIAMSEAILDGFILAMRSLGEIIVNSLKSVMTKEGRRDLREQSVPLGDFLRDFFDPETSATFAGGGSFIPQAAGGMRYTGNQRSGLAMLHQGEFVVPQSGMRPQSVDRQMNSSGGSAINIVINGTVVEQNAVDALVRRIEERFNSNFGLASSNLFGGR